MAAPCGTTRSMFFMATNRADHTPDEPEDPIHEEVRLVMSDPEVRAAIREVNERLRSGDRLPRVSSNDVRRSFGLPTVPSQD